MFGLPGAAAAFSLLSIPPRRRARSRPAISAFAASHSASRGRRITGSTMAMILSRSV